MRNKIKRKIKSLMQYRIVQVLLFIFSCGGLFIIPSKIKAIAFTSIVESLGWIFYALYIWVMGHIANLAGKILVWVSTFTNFTTLPVIKETWTVVRDISNLFFIVILLVIAFGTILKLEAYSYKKLLPKMIFAAIMVNFSLLMCSLIVDASQVVMLTFVNAFKDAAEEGFYSAFRLGDLISIDDTKNENQMTSPEYLIAVIAAGVMITVMTMLLLTAAITLVARMVFIWTLTILSPIAFVASILPATQKYSQRWWEMFGRYVAVGPLLAFFIWLALFVVIKSGSDITNQLGSDDIAKSLGVTDSTSVGKALQPDIIVKYLIATVMIFSGLKFANEMASEIAPIAGKIANIPKSLGMGVLNTFGRGAKGAARGVGKGALWGAGQIGLYATDKLEANYGLALNPMRWGEKIKAGWKENAEERRIHADAGSALALMEGKKRGIFGNLDLLVQHPEGVLHTASGKRTKEYTRLQKELEDREKKKKQLEALADKDATSASDIVKAGMAGGTDDLNNKKNAADAGVAAQQAIIVQAEEAVAKATEAVAIAKEQLAAAKPGAAHDAAAQQEQIERENLLRSQKDLRNKKLELVGKVRVQADTDKEVNDNKENISNQADAAAKNARDGHKADLAAIAKEIDATKVGLSNNAPMKVPGAEEGLRKLTSRGEQIHSKDFSYLTQCMRNALATNRMADAVAILRQIFTAGHQNNAAELMGEERSFEGVAAMIDKYFTKGGESKPNKKFKGNVELSKDMALQLLQDCSEQAFENKEHSYAQGVETNEAGTRRRRTRAEREEVSAIEMSKMTAEQFVQLGHEGIFEDHNGPPGSPGSFYGPTASYLVNLESVVANRSNQEKFRMRKMPTVPSNTINNIHADPKVKEMFYTTIIEAVPKGEARDAVLDTYGFAGKHNSKAPVPFARGLQKMKQRTS